MKQNDYELIIAYLTIYSSLLKALTQEIKGTRFENDSLNQHLKCAMLSMLAAYKDIERTNQEPKNVCY